MDFYEHSLYIKQTLIILDHVLFLYWFHIAMLEPIMGILKSLAFICMHSLALHTDREHTF